MLERKSGDYHCLCGGNVEWQGHSEEKDGIIFREEFWGCIRCASRYDEKALRHLREREAREGEDDMGRKRALVDAPRTELNEWLKRIGIDTREVTRVVIDIAVNEVVQIYIQRHADKRLLDVHLPEAILKAKMHEETQTPEEGSNDGGEDEDAHKL